MDTKDAEVFWQSLETDAEGCDADHFVTMLAEQWDTPDPIINLIAREIIRMEGRGSGKVSKDRFLNFVRTFGPWPKEGCSASSNPMLCLILRDFFDESKKQAKQNFHGYLDEKSAYKILKAPGEFLYRYSSGRPGCIAVSRASTTKRPDGKLQHTTDVLANTGNGTWQLVASKMVFQSLLDFEAKHKEKLLRLVCTTQEQQTGGAYLTYLTEEDAGGDSSYAPAFTN